MNQTSSSVPGASLLPDSTGLFTAANLLIIVLFAVVVVIGILYGARLKHRRIAAEREVAEHNREIAATPPAADGPVTQLKGLGPRVAARLAELGVTTVGQLAALSDDDAAALDGRLGQFTGRLERDRWIEQARFLAAGDKAGFEAVFGRL